MLKKELEIKLKDAHKEIKELKTKLKIKNDTIDNLNIREENLNSQVDNYIKLCLDIEKITKDFSLFFNIDIKSKINKRFKVFYNKIHNG